MNELKKGDVASFFDLSGKIALITGAGRGIGRAVALALAGAGSDVALVARSEDQLESAAEEIQALGRRAVAFPADLTQIQQQASLTKKISQTMGGIDILVNNAGINIPEDSVDVTEKSWDTLMNINLKGAFFMAQAVGKLMITQKRGGRIINITSSAGIYGNIGQANYSAAKAGIIGLTKSNARELVKHGICVNAVAPAAQTSMTDSMPEKVREMFYKQLAATATIQRMGQPEDVAPTVVFLASDDSYFVTGQVICVMGAIGVI